MNKPSLIERLTPWLWILVGLDLLSALVVVRIPITSLAVAAFALAWFLITLIPATLLLTIRCRARFAYWQSWALLLAFWIVAIVVGQGFVAVPFAGLRLLGSLATLCIGLALLVGLSIRLVLRDFGLPLLAWFSLLCVWSAVIWWRLQGDPIAAMFESIERPDQPSAVFWLSFLFSTFLCITPLALTSFVLHTVRLAVAELQ